MNNYELIDKLQRRLRMKPDDLQSMQDLFEMARIVDSEKDHATAMQLCRQIVRDAGAQSRVIRIDYKASEQFLLLHKRALLFGSHDYFDYYLRYIEFDREPERRFYLPRRKQIYPVVQAMQDLHDDSLDLLTLSEPPGIGKSTLGIFYLSWEMGLAPEKCNLASAHADKLTRSFYNGVNSILDDPEYLWHDVFPGLRVVNVSAKDETVDLKSKKRFPTLTCRSIDGSLTGATRCENILYADDLVSGIEEAMSRDRMDTLWQKYTNDLKSRKKLGCKEIHIATRWSVHDVIGRLERQYTCDPRARFLSFPALNEKDESNFDYQFGVGFDTKYFWDMRESLDEVSWKCLFMNEPIEREGLLYHEDELRRYFELPPQEPDAIISICDTKDKGTDYAFEPVAYIYGDDFYIGDCVCDNGLPEVVDERLAELLVRHNVKAARYESNSAGGRVAEKVQQRVKELGGITHITTKFTTANKETKIIVNSAWVKEHCLFKDKSKYHRQSDYGKMILFLCSYTVMGKNKHDDVPDGMAMLAEFSQSLNAGTAKPIKRPF